MLRPDMLEAVLARLGFRDVPPADHAGLAAVYAAWCRTVPFDNLVKRIHLASGSATPFPNGRAEPFFAAFLDHGVGGTCWPSSGGLHALLVALGFDARRGSGAMRDDVAGPVHSHGTVLVRIDGVDHWVDTSMLTRDVLPLARGNETRIERALDPVRADPVGSLWRVWWQHPFLEEELGCLLLDEDVTEEHYLARYEASRDMSPFNTAVYAVRSTGHGRVTVAFSQRFERTAAGVTSAPIGDDRDRILVEEFGYSEAIVARLPADDPAVSRSQ